MTTPKTAGAKPTASGCHSEARIINNYLTLVVTPPRTFLRVVPLATAWCRASRFPLALPFFLNFVLTDTVSRRAGKVNAGDVSDKEPRQFCPLRQQRSPETQTELLVRQDCFAANRIDLPTYTTAKYMDTHGREEGVSQTSDACRPRSRYCGGSAVPPRASRSHQHSPSLSPRLA